MLWKSSMNLAVMGVCVMGLAVAITATGCNGEGENPPPGPPAAPPTTPQEGQMPALPQDEQTLTVPPASRQEGSIAGSGLQEGQNPFQTSTSTSSSAVVAPPPLGSADESVSDAFSPFPSTDSIHAPPVGTDETVELSGELNAGEPVPVERYQDAQDASLGSSSEKPSSEP